MKLIEAKNISKAYSQIDKEIQILKNLDLELESGSTTAILGKSGSGKSTLISILSGLESIDEGELKILGSSVKELSEKKINELRRSSYGIVFQRFHLLPHLTALDNVMLPLELNGISDAKTKALAAIEKVGLIDRQTHKPSQLSGGEQQRIALARAIVHDPKIILADEPSGSLDEHTGREVMDLLFSIAKTSDSALVLVTHDTQLAKRCETVLNLENGKLVERVS